MRIRLFGAAVFVGTTLLGADAHAQLAPQWESCAENPDLGERIKACTALIQSGQEMPKNLAVAYNDRGNAYSAKGDFDRAIADYSAAIRLDPKYAAAYGNRGNANSAEGRFDRAIADCSDAIRLEPGYALAYRTRGIAYFYNGDLAKALADVGQASKLDPQEAYSALWLDIVEKRDNVASSLPQAALHIDMTAWPAPIIRMFLGRATPAAVLAAANEADATNRKGQVCEANFYSGALALRSGARDEAIRLFRLASSDCPRYFDEWGAANHELKALDTTPSTSQHILERR